MAAVTFMWQHSLHGQCGYCCNNRGGQYQEQCVLTVAIDSDACMLKSGQMAERPLVGVFHCVSLHPLRKFQLSHGWPWRNRLLLAFLGVPRLDVFPWQAAQRGSNLFWTCYDTIMTCIYIAYTRTNTHTRILIYIYIYIYIHTI